MRKLLLFNAHGGQVGLMDIVGRDLRARHDLIVYHSNWYDLPLADAAMAPFDAAERRFGVHGGDIETSMMLALRPGRVDMAQAQDFRVHIAAARAATIRSWAMAAAPAGLADAGLQPRRARPAMPRSDRATRGGPWSRRPAQQLALLLAELSQLAAVDAGRRTGLSRAASRCT